MISCDQCGEPLKEFSKFCFKCGFKIDDVTSEKLILNSLSSTESQKLFKYLNARLNLVESKVDRHLESLKRIEKLLLDNDLIHLDEVSESKVDVQTKALDVVEAKSSESTDISVHAENVIESIPEISESHYKFDPEPVEREAQTSALQHFEEIYGQDQRSVPTLPIPELFPLEVEYTPHIDPIPEPKLISRKITIRKQSFFQRFKDFIENQGLIAGGLSSILLLMLFSALALFQNNFELQSLSLSAVGAFMILAGIFLLSGKLGATRHNLGSISLNSGFYLTLGSSINLLQGTEESLISTFMPYILYALVILMVFVGIIYQSNGTALSMSFIIPLTIAYLSQRITEPIFYFGGILWYIPLVIMTLIFGIREYSFYPAILLTFTGLTTSMAYGADYVGGYSLVIFASILPLAIILDRGKVEVLRPYLIINYLVLFSGPLIAYVYLYYRNLLSAWDSLGFLLGSVVLYQIATTEVNRGGFRRSLLFSSVLQEMQKFARYVIPISGIIASVIFGIQIKETVSDKFIVDAFLPSVLFVTISIAYTVSIFYRNFNKPSRTEIFSALGLTEVSILIVTGNLARVSITSGYYIVPSIFAIIALILPLIIGIIGQYLTEKLYYGSSFLLLSNGLTVLNSFLLVNVFGLRNESILFVIIGLMVFPLSVLLPSLSDVNRRRNYQISLVANGISIIITQLLGNYQGISITFINLNLGIRELGPFIVFALYVFASGVAFYTLSKIAPKVIDKRSSGNFLLSPSNYILGMFENLMLRYQELSFSLFVNLTFTVFAVSNGFQGPNNSNLFVVSVLLMLIPVNFVTMYLARGRHWATIIPSILPYATVAYKANDYLSLSINLTAYGIIILLGFLLARIDHQKERSNFVMRVSGRDLSIWIGLFLSLFLTETIDPYVYYGIIILQVISSGFSTFLLGRVSTSGIQLAVSSVALQLIVPNFASENPVGTFPELLVSTLPLIVGSLAFTLINLRKSAKGSNLINLRDSSLVISSLFLPYLPASYTWNSTSSVLLMTTLLLVNLSYITNRLISKDSFEFTNLTFILMGLQFYLTSVGDVQLMLLKLVSFIIPVMAVLFMSPLLKDETRFMGESIAIAAIFPLINMNDINLMIIHMALISSGLIYMKMRGQFSSHGISTFLALSGGLQYLFGNQFDKLSIALADSFLQIGTIELSLFLLVGWMFLSSIMEVRDKFTGIDMAVVAFFNFIFISVGGANDFSIQVLMITFTIAVGIFENKVGSTHHFALSLSVLGLPLSRFGEAEAFNLLIFYSVQSLVTIIEIERTKTDKETALLKYQGIIIISSLYALLANFTDPFTFMISTTVIGLIFMIYKWVSKVEIKDYSIAIPIVLTLKLIILSSVGYSAYSIVIFGENLNGLFIALNILLAIGFLAYSNSTNIKISLVFLSIVSSLFAISQLGDTYALSLPLILSSYSLWKEKDENSHLVISIYHLVIIAFYYSVNPSFVALPMLIFVGNFIYMTIQVFASEENTTSSQKFYLGVNMLILGSFVQIKDVWGDFVSLTYLNFLDFIWLGLLIIYQLIILLDIREGGFTILSVDPNNSALKKFLGMKFSSFSDALSLLGIVQSAVFLLWGWNTTLSWLVPVLILEGLVVLVTLLMRSVEIEEESMILLIATMAAQGFTAIYNMINGGFLNSMLIAEVKFDLTAVVSYGYVLPLMFSGVLAIYSKFSMDEQGIVPSSLGFVLSIGAIIVALSIDSYSLVGVYPAVIAIAFLGISIGVSSKDEILTTFATISYYLTGMYYGNQIVVESTVFALFDVSMSGVSMVMITLSVIMFSLAVWIESNFKLGESFGPVMLITILVLTYFGFTSNQFITGTEKMVTFMSLAFSSSMSYWYGVRFSRSRVRYLGLGILLTGFIGGLGLMVYYLSQGTLDFFLTSLTLLSSTIAFLFVIGVNQVNKGEEKQNILRILQPLER